MSSVSNLDALPIPLIIAAQHRPAGAIALDELQIQLGAQDAERRLLRVNGRKQCICILVPLVVRGGEVEDDRVRAELNLGAFLVDFLEVEGDVDSGGSLVEIIPGVKRYCQYVLNAQQEELVSCTYLTESTFSSPAPLALPTNMCLVFSVHPGIFKNSSNSSTRRLQHDHPLLPSWKTGWPGWCTHFSSSRAVDPL